MFELGFFSPGKSKNRYMGIWYKKISYGTVVWVANRETPIADRSGMLKLNRQGNLVIRSGGNPMVWSSNPVESMQGRTWTLTLQWIERIQDWIVYAESEVDNCDRFSLCGAYGICNINKHPPCSCMQGFEPRHPEEWEGSDWASGCKRREPLTCGDGKGDGFLKIPGVKPAKGTAFVQVMQILDIRNGGSGCLLWLDELLDTRVYDGDQDLYIRLAASELEGVVNSRSNFNKEKRTHIVVLITSSVVPLLFAVAYAFRKIKKRPHMKSQGKWYVYDEKNTSLQIEQLDDLQFFSLYEVARATDNFSVSNKIGQGGFGPVYKMKPEAEA
ncbi:putative non-specific serine/threonine protein kinase [Helianthus annuus]|nr:putative non-specific serine/threonine protein kinase [Helianthus annuus]KAJ0505236.1 putative non-specific serine/threonine protein kinase [Helianthus annuus]KAJ0674918.1 putative non-specific serine/threonine protein kinase [Helianthus annuus]